MSVSVFLSARLSLVHARENVCTHPYAAMHWRMCAGVESAQCLLSVLQSCCTACGTEVVRLARRHGGRDGEAPLLFPHDCS